MESLKELLQSEIGLDSDIADEVITLVENFYVSKKIKVKRTQINQESYQRFQRAQETNRSATQTQIETGFGRSTIFVLRKDYKETGYYWQNFASHHKEDEIWQKQTQCPKHFGYPLHFLTTDMNHCRVVCPHCNWFKEFSRFPAIKDIIIEEYVERDHTRPTQYEFGNEV